MSILNLFHFDYWFSQPFTARGSALWCLLAILLFIVVGLVLKFYLIAKAVKPKN